MSEAIVRSISTGLSQKGVRNHNERLLLSLLLRHGALPASDLARRAGLSPPTVSAILKRLEIDGLLMRGEPVRGRVGKPSRPMRLSPDGALSWGLKIGRRSAELVLLDLTGVTRAARRVVYADPVPEAIFAFLHQSIADISAGLTPVQRGRLCGIGVAAPFEMQGRPGGLHPSPWDGIDVAARVAGIAGLPALSANDATAACRAEQVFGRGKEFRDYAYFFVGVHVGGGVVLDHSVYEGRQGNAGALGALPTLGPLGESLQLGDTASIHLLERRLKDAEIDPQVLWARPQDWSAIARHVDPWLGEIAQQLARASMSICAVIDFEAILIDGAFPEEIRMELVERVRRYVAFQDVRGLITPRVEAGTIGPGARSAGAATGPIAAQFLLGGHPSD